MKIESSTVALSAQQQSFRFHQVDERLELRRGRRLPPGPPQHANAVHNRSDERGAAVVELSAHAHAMRPRRGELAAGGHVDATDKQQRFESSLLKLLVEKITGREIKVVDPGELQKTDDGSDDRDDDDDRHPEHGRAAEDRGGGFGMHYQYHEVHRESQQMSFRAEGSVKTADGREISFSAELNMSREFYNERSLEFETGTRLKDPLVLNFDGAAAELTRRDFSFDIDMDGSEDQIAFVGGDSGFLALDRNGDGRINDGSELFGPGSGDGFAELAAHDSDNNSWIDENDPIYAKLRIWSRDANGDQQLLGLGQRGVGAIFLGNVASDFSVRDDDNRALGEIRSSGVFLEEDGGVGTVQHIDLVV